MENKKFVNQYEYNIELVKESISAWWNKKFKNLTASMLICMMIFMIIYFVTMKIVYLSISLLCFLPIILLVLKRNVSIKTELERINVVYKKEPLLIKVILDESIHTITSQGQRDIELSSVESFVETKNLIVLMIKGSMTIAFSKNGFIEGTYEEFLECLNEIIKK